MKRLPWQHRRRFAAVLVPCLAVAWGAVVGTAGPCGAAITTVRARVSADSQAPGYEASRAMDGDPETMWHTRWGHDETGHPHDLVIDLGRSYRIAGFSYLPRRGGGNGTIRQYELYLSENPKQFGDPVCVGSFGPGDAPKRVNLPAERSGRYVRLRALSEVGGRRWTSVAELEVLCRGVEFRAEAAAATRRAGRPHAFGPDDGTLQGALELARRTLAFVERAASRPRLAAELAALQRRIEQSADHSAADQSAAGESSYAEIRRLRRRIILSHPLLDFERLLINKRPPPAFSHQSDQYLGRYSGQGAGLVVLERWKGEPRETVLLEGKLPPGSVLHPDLSFDARRVLFAYCDHSQADARLRRFFLYEIGIDGRGLRQITGTPADPMEGADGRQTVLIEDFDPCYLPDGGIAFISTRNQGGVRCHHGGRYCPTYLLYRCEHDGSRLRQLSFGEANEWDPSVLPDGRLIWTRWDYINRHDTVYQSLWTIRPDGTGTAHFYGNYTRNPCSIAEARAIPGSRKVVATATAHHSYTAGSVIVVDPHAGQDGQGPITRVTPEVAFPETEGWSEGSYATPYPLSEDLFLAAYSPERHARQGARQGRSAYGIYLIDTLGGRELIYRDPQTSCFAPIPVVRRETPPALPSLVAAEAKESPGMFCVRDVYRSTESIPPGSIKRLRVVQILPQPVQRVPDRSFVLFETAKRILGTVPVEEDGSVAFVAPSGVPLLFQLLDGNGMAVMGMRTFVYLQPGESVSCLGCHEPRHSAPARVPMPAGVPFRDLTPPAGPRYPGGLSFVRTVQPVLDRYCIGCHGLDRTEGGLDLLGTMAPGPVRLGKVRASAAYHSLTSRPGLISVAHRNRETPASKPKDYYSHAGRLAHMLLEGDEHHPTIDRESFQRIVDWLDLNGQFYGDYSWNKHEWRPARPEGERALREHVREVFGPQLARQPLAALVNLAMPGESRILKAPLAVEAGGWGQISPPGWDSTEEAGYREMRRLVSAVPAPLEARDLAGTCGREPCVCGGCWVRHARDQWRTQAASAGRGLPADTRQAAAR